MRAGLAGADCLFGGTLGYMLQFKVIEPRAEYEAYARELQARPAHIEALRINKEIIQERGLG